MNTISEPTQSLKSESLSKENHGLLVLYEPSDVCEMDIVAVHGIGGDREKTWAATDAKDNPPKLWLRDFLPQDLPTARVMTYGYDDHSERIVTMLNFEEAAYDMIRTLDTVRQTTAEKERPLIFICHSTGGLVVKAVTIMSNIRKDPKPTILQATRAILFLATPHRDSPKLIEILFQATRRPKFRKVVGVHKKLDSAELHILQDQFVHISSSIVIYSFYEKADTMFGKGATSEKYSAYIGLPHERLISINADFTRICKFATSADEGYRLILKCLMETLENIQRKDSTFEIDHRIATKISERIPGSAKKDFTSPGNDSGSNDFLVRGGRRRPLDVGSATFRSGASEAPSQPKLSQRIVPPDTEKVVFDSVNESSAMSTGRDFGDRWFEELAAAVHPVVDERHKNSDIPVRVAIIDSGIDSKHPLLKDMVDKGQIKSKTFVDGISDDDDMCGHGTHVAHVIMKVAPRIELYVARVFLSGQTGELERNKAAIAMAISHATTQWKVDIISISWGIRKDVSEIKEALRHAFHNGVIIFAAASNSGSNPRYPVTFPASMRQVICINSTDGFGNPSDFNPRPPKPDRRFCVIGEGIEAAWPTQLGDSNVKVASGTSIATPIAAGLAALVLQYARQPGNRGWRVENHKRLNHCDEMRKVFEAMGEDFNDFRCIKASTIFGKGGDDANRHVRICSAISDILDSL